MDAADYIHPEMLKCGECRFIDANSGKCKVAEKRKDKGVRYDHSDPSGDFPTWTYKPPLDKLVRCKFGQKAI